MKVSNEIEDLVPYKPGKPIEETQREYGLEKVYKLASNENPLGPSEKVLEAMTQAIKEVHRYPDASCYELKKRAAKSFGLKENQITFGNGSNELIDLLIRIFCLPKDQILTSHGAFIAYKICAQAARVQTVETPMTADLKFDLKAMEKALLEDRQRRIKLIFIANPNNPTGTYLNENEMDQFLSLAKDFPDSLFVLDEAYVDYVRAEDYKDGLKYLKQYSNVVLTRTFSKIFGLAGLRVGALLGDSKIVQYVDRVRNPFNVNSIAQVAAIAALDDHSYIEKVQQVTWKGLDRFYQYFDSKGIKYLSSQANFLLVDFEHPVGELNQKLLQKGLIVRPVAAYGLPNTLRVSVGTEEENEAAISVFDELLG